MCECHLSHLSPLYDHVGFDHVSVTVARWTGRELNRIKNAEAKGTGWLMCRNHGLVMDIVTKEKLLTWTTKIYYSNLQQV